MDSTQHCKLLKEVEEIREAIINLKKECLVIQLHVETKDLQKNTFVGDKRPVLIEIDNNSSPKKKQKTKN